MTAALTRADALRLPLADDSVDLICTSPPYFALRSYRDEGEHYGGQLGSEDTPQAFLDALWAATAEMARVLKPSGSIFVNLGDRYSPGERWDDEFTVEDAAWLAGVLDSDGSFGVHLDGKRSFVPWVRIGQMRPEVVHRAGRVTGIGQVFQDKRGCWHWNVASQQARWVAERVWPWLHIKRKPALALVELARHISERKAKGSWRPLTDEDVRYRTMIRESVMAWNRGERVEWEPPLVEMVPLPRTPRMLPSKSLSLLPERYRIGCVDRLGLIARAVVVWDKPNGLPESVTDRVRRSHEDWMHLTKAPRYFAAVDEIRSVSNSTRRTDGAPFGVSALGPELTATVLADDRPTYHRGWCNLGESQVAVVPPVAANAHRLQVVDPVGLQVRVEVAKRDDVVDLQVVSSGASIGAPAVDTPRTVTLKRQLSLLGPVGAAVVASSPSPSGAVLASQSSTPCPVTLTGAEATGFEVALLPGHGFAARIALTGPQGEASLLVWDASAAHQSTVTEGYDSLGALPGSVWSIPSEPLRVPDHLPQHFAAMPTEWPRRLILGWSPSGICVECGEGRRPVVESSHYDPDRPQYRRALELAEQRGLTDEHLRAIRAVGVIDTEAGAVRSGGRYTSDSGKLAAEAKEQLGGYYRELCGSGAATIVGYACACTPYTDHAGSGKWAPATKGWSAEASVRKNRNQDNPGGGLGNVERVGPRREYHLDGWTPPPTRPAVVLDPFAGTGTTVLVARALGRFGVGVDLSADYLRLARWRVFESRQGAKAVRRTNLERQGGLFTQPDAYRPTDVVETGGLL